MAFQMRSIDQLRYVRATSIRIAGTGQEISPLTFLFRAGD
jgi:hypothetical protein